MTSRLGSSFDARRGVRWVTVLVAALAIVLGSVAWAPPAHAAVVPLQGLTIDDEGLEIPGAVVTIHDPSTGSLLGSDTADPYGMFEFFVEEGFWYELRGTAPDGRTGTDTFYANDDGYVYLVLRRPPAPVTITGTVPIVDGHQPYITLSCSNPQQGVYAELDGTYTVSGMTDQTNDCDVQVYASPNDGVVQISRPVPLVADGLGALSGVANFTFPAAQTLRFVNHDGSPATSGALSLSTSAWYEVADGGVESFTTYLTWDLGDGDAVMILGPGEFEFSISLESPDYLIEDLGIISQEPGGLLFTIPDIRMLNISGAAPPGGPSSPTRVEATCGADDYGTNVAPTGTYALEFPGVAVPRCDLRLEAYVNDTEVSVRRTVVLVDGAGVADFGIPEDLTVTVTDAEGQPVTDAYLSFYTSGELLMPDGAVADVNANAEVVVDGSPIVLNLVRAAEQGYQLQVEDGLFYDGTIDTLGQSAVDLVIPHFARVVVSGTVEGWEPGHSGSVTVSCQNSGSTAAIAGDGSFVVSADAWVLPSCDLILIATADGTRLYMTRTVGLGPLSGGVATGSGDFAIPAPVTLHAVDGSGDPALLTGSLAANDYTVTMPDGAVAGVSASVDSLTFAGSPVVARLPRNADAGYFYLTDGDLYQAYDEFGFPGAGDLTFVVRPPGSDPAGVWIDGAPTDSTDGDGVTDVIESGAPNSGDGNFDGTPDADQANVTSLPGSTGDYVTLEVPAGTSFGPVAAVDPASYGSPPGGVTLPDGLVSFELTGLTPGTSATVRIYSPSVAAANGYAKWQNGAWVVLPAGDVVPNVPGGYVGVTLTDGGIGDDDGAANGTIVDPGGLAILTDSVDPVLSCESAPSGWSSVNVTIACTASDAGSGLADPADATFELVTSVALGEETESASTGEREVCDVAGNCVTAGPIAGLKVDRNAPTITINAPIDGATVSQEAELASSYSCADTGSGLDSCVGPVISGQPVPVGDLGLRSFVVTATDEAGNEGTRTVTYTVVAANSAPTVRADMGVPALEVIGSQSNLLVLSGSFADADGNGPFVATIRWEGTSYRSAAVSGTTFSAAYVYPRGGTRLVTVRVCDAAGACGTDTVTVRTRVNRKVTPVAQCVVDRGSGESPRYSGRFGYNNAGDVPLWIPTSGRVENAFTTGAAGRGQPQVFLPGSRRGVFETAFSTGTQTWRLNGKTASLSSSSRRC